MGPRARRATATWRRSEVGALKVWQEENKIHAQQGDMLLSWKATSASAWSTNAKVLGVSVAQLRKAFESPAPSASDVNAALEVAAGGGRVPQLLCAARTELRAQDVGAAVQCKGVVVFAPEGSMDAVTKARAALWLHGEGLRRVHETSGGSELAAPKTLRSMLAARVGEFEPPDPEEWEDYLAERGLEVGGDLTGPTCPNACSPKTSRCGQVFEDRIWCFRCGQGFPAQTLIGGGSIPEPHPVLAAAAEVVPWTTVSRMTEARGLTKQTYRALMAGFFDDPELTEKAFDWPWLRAFDNTWLNADCTPAGKEITQGLLQTSCAWTRGAPVRAALALGRADLPGWRKFLPSPGYVTPSVLAPANTQFLSRPSNARCEKGDTQWLEKRLPGFEPRFALRFLVPMLFAQEGSAQTWLYAHGVPGSGKASYPCIAAAAIDGPVRRRAIADGSRSISELVGSAAAAGCAAFVAEELDKTPVRKSQAGILALGEQVTHHRLFVGEVTVPLRMALIGTGQNIPVSIAGSAEFSRRFWVCRFTKKVGDWTGLTWASLREIPEAARALNHLLWEAEEFRRGKSKQTCLRELGFRPILECGDAVVRQQGFAAFRELFDDLPPSRWAKYPAEYGWRELDIPQDLREVVCSDRADDWRYSFGYNIRAHDWGDEVFEMQLGHDVHQFVGRFQNADLFG